MAFYLWISKTILDDTLWFQYLHGLAERLCEVMKSPLYPGGPMDVMCSTNKTNKFKSILNKYEDMKISNSLRDCRHNFKGLFMFDQHLINNFEDIGTFPSKKWLIQQISLYLCLLYKENLIENNHILAGKIKISCSQLKSHRLWIVNWKCHYEFWSTWNYCELSL